MAGDSNYCTSGDLVGAVSGSLASNPDLTEVRFDFAEVTSMDPSGLSALLIIHRPTSTAGARLHLRKTVHMDGGRGHRGARVPCAAIVVHPAIEQHDRSPSVPLRGV
ncbi:hypothetical protein ACIGO6_39220 [Streptomyces sp. NPDC053750]|uniref:hypothetical protein n=1 Tax=Streptomyces sp. NPDC053750 TaxID=3365714 RepID=UPI0037D87337